MAQTITHSNFDFNVKLLKNLTYPDLALNKANTVYDNKTKIYERVTNKANLRGYQRMPIEARQHQVEDTSDRKHKHNTNTKFRAHLYVMKFALKRKDIGKMKQKKKIKLL